MPRSAMTNVTVHSVPAKTINGITVVHPAGNTLTVYSDGAVYNETTSKFENINDLKRS